MIVHASTVQVLRVAQFSVAVSVFSISLYVYTESAALVPMFMRSSVYAVVWNGVAARGGQRQVPMYGM